MNHQECSSSLFTVNLLCVENFWGSKPWVKNFWVYVSLEPVHGPVLLLLLLQSHFNRVRLCVTPWTATHKAPPSLGFSRKEHWSGLPFPSPVYESEKWKWSHYSCPTLSDPMDCSLPGSSIHGIFQGRVLEWGAIAFSLPSLYSLLKTKTETQRVNWSLFGFKMSFSSVQFSRSVMSDSLQPHESQHARPPCPCQKVNQGS